MTETTRLLMIIAIELLQFKSCGNFSTPWKHVRHGNVLWDRRESIINLQEYPNQFLIQP